MEQWYVHLKSESRHFESGIESESTPFFYWIRIQIQLHPIRIQIQLVIEVVVFLRTRNLESGFESESTLVFLNPIPDPSILALNPNQNPAQKALNPDIKSESGLGFAHHWYGKSISQCIRCSFSYTCMDELLAHSMHFFPTRCQLWIFSLFHIMHIVSKPIFHCYCSFTIFLQPSLMGRLLHPLLVIRVISRHSVCLTVFNL